MTALNRIENLNPRLLRKLEVSNLNFSGGTTIKMRYIKNCKFKQDRLSFEYKLEMQPFPVFPAMGLPLHANDILIKKIHINEVTNTYRRRYI